MLVVVRDSIRLRVVTQDGHEDRFRVMQHTPLAATMYAFCNRRGASMRSVRFLFDRFDGNRINETQTPGQLEMEDGAEIHVMPAWSNRRATEGLLLF